MKRSERRACDAAMHVPPGGVCTFIHQWGGFTQDSWP